MSILSSLLRDVAALFFPPRCPVCGRMLAQGEHTVCTLCRATAPLTGFWRQADNPVLGRCRDMLPVEWASGLLYYVHGSGWRELIRGFKYRGAWRTARAMGDTYVALPADAFGPTDFVDEGHFSAAGARRFAAILAPVVRQTCR